MITRTYIHRIYFVKQREFTWPWGRLFERRLICVAQSPFSAIHPQGRSEEDKEGGVCVISDLPTTFPTLINIFPPKLLACGEGGGGIATFFPDVKKIFRTRKKFSGYTKKFSGHTKFFRNIPKNFPDIPKIFQTYQNVLTFCVILVNLAKFLLILLFFHPNHSNIFAAYGNDLPIKPLFCRKDVFRGCHTPTPPL